MSHLPFSSYTTPTEVIEHALMHVRQASLPCRLCFLLGEIDAGQLDLAVDSRLINARGLIDVARRGDPGRRVIQRTVAVLGHLIDEAIQLRAMRHGLEANEGMPSSGIQGVAQSSSDGAHPPAELSGTEP